MLKGIDISEHQGRVDWDKVKTQVDFVILRAGYGRNNIDKFFHRNIKECNRLGIPVGVYWFSYAYSVDMAKKEAKFILDAIKDYRVEYPVIFDLEYDTLNYAKKNGVNISKRLATDMVKGFCNVIEDAGYYAMNYANPDFINNKFYQSELKRYSLWLAHYTSESNKSIDCLIWQYSESGKVNGVNGKVDMNKAYSDVAKIIRDNKLNRLTSVSKPVSSSKPKGDYGTVTASVLNVRNGAGTNYRIIGQLKRGDKVHIASRVGEWYSLWYGDHGGFVHSKYISR